MKSKSFSKYINKIAAIGIGMGLIMFILTRSGVFELPIVIGTTSYEGMASSLMLLTGFPILLILICSILYWMRK
ncbi:MULTISPECIES: hypothetical protein [unclassified Paenibacillus]|uniref:hypothetical protein n=1 Tax=unclassified Paenibacillus TaxID=185978 RepID=UPI0003E21952|nr:MULTISPECIES: hypothetical protein [unclassified Paenibacillus]ETT54277.1 hypothetical protein C162_05494 [Paenibacillus sp. FSL R7-269]OMF91347.1 hypothetical protein BK147_21810 [Paenibacillus sp. FSL R7-0337]